MNTGFPAGGRSADELLDEALPSDPIALPERRAAFKQRILDFEATAESNASELGGMLTYVMADVVGITGDMADGIKQALSDGQATLDRLQQMKGPLNDYFKAARQVEHYATVALRIEATKLQSAGNSPSKRPLGTVRRS